MADAYLRAIDVSARAKHGCRVLCEDGRGGEKPAKGLRNPAFAGGLRTKDNRPAGQGGKREEIQPVVVLIAMQPYILEDLPTIPGELPRIHGITRTIAGEKRLTGGGSQ